MIDTDNDGYENDDDRELTMHHNTKMEDINDSENKPNEDNTKHFLEKQILSDPIRFTLKRAQITNSHPNSF